MSKFLQCIFTVILWIGFIAPLAAQSEWEHFIARGESFDVEIYNDSAYVAHSSGLLIIDLETKEETLIHPGNYNVPVQGFREIEMLDNGEMWLSSAQEGHLYYFDGEIFTRQCDSIRHATNLVFANDKLWFMSGAGLNYPILYQSELFSLEGEECINHGDLNIYSLTSDQNDKFWYVTGQSINQFDGENIIESITLPNQIYVVYAHFIDSEDRHWLSTDLSVPFLFIYENEDWITSFTNKFVKNFYEFESGKISAFLTNNDFVTFIDYQQEETELFENISEESSILLVEDTASIWFSTEKRFHTNRLFWSNLDTITEFMIDEDIIASTVGDLTEDCDGTLITASRPFLQKRIDNAWQTIPLATDNEGCYFGRFIDDSHSCEVWLGGSYDQWSAATINNCLSVWELKEDSLYEQEILPQYRLVLYRDYIGNIYLTSPSPLVIHKTDTDGVYTTDTLAGFIATYDLHFVESGTMIMTAKDTSHNLSINIKENDVWSEFDLSSLAIPNLKIKGSIHEDSEGNLWFPESNGFIKYDGENLFYFPVGIEITTTTVHHNHITDDSYGNLWLATQRDGLIRWNPDTTIIYTTANSNLLSNYCRELQIIDDDLWVNHYYGLTKFKIDELTNLSDEPNAKALNYSLFPNPSTGNITLTNPLLEKRNIEIYTVSGVFVSRHTNSNSEWNTTLKSGIYLIVISAESGVVVEKVVIFGD